MIDESYLVKGLTYIKTMLPNFEDLADDTKKCWLVELNAKRFQPEDLSVGVRDLVTNFAELGRYYSVNKFTFPDLIYFLKKARVERHKKQEDKLAISEGNWTDEKTKSNKEAIKKMKDKIGIRPDKPKS